MTKSYKSVKIEIKPTREQIEKINKTIGTGRFLYNLYISYNIEQYRKDKTFITAFDFSKYVNNVYIKENVDKIWIKDVSSKSNKQSIINSEKAFKRFFKKLGGFPKFKKKNKGKQTCYFPKNNKTDFEYHRHKIKIPTLGYIRLKEYGYIPTNAVIKSGTISRTANRYFLSLVLEKENTVKVENKNTNGIGVDFGIKNTIICSNGIIFKNINKTDKVIKLNRRIRRLQRKIIKSINYSREKHIKLYNLKNFNKKKIQLQKLFYRLNCIRNDYNNKIVNELTKTKLKYITIEDLKISNMLKNRHLSKAIQEQNFYSLKLKLLNKCKDRNIELRVVDTFYPSSKLCSSCGNIKKDLKLSDRIYKCEVCKTEMDRDYNASLNLEKATVYRTIA